RCRCVWPLDIRYQASGVVAAPITAPPTPPTTAPGSQPTPVVPPTSAPAPAPIAPPVTARSPGELPQAERPSMMANTAMNLVMTLLTQGSGRKFPELLQRPVAAENRVPFRQRRCGDIGHGLVVAALARPVL